MTLLKSFLMLTGIFFFSLSNAQQKTIKGVVADSAGTPLSKASVRIKGTTQGTVTNENGEFTLVVSVGTELEVSSVGYIPTNVTVNSDDFIVIRLNPALDTTLRDIVLVGTRSSGRVRLETPVPIDVVNMNQAALTSGRMDVSSILNFTVPSFNYNKQSGSDGADHIDLATLRGLGPDQTLVLINGKRRHQTAFVAVFGTRGRGNSGTDLSAIPTGAIDRVEVLRDGASAQYGSDAIAGVINIITKKSTGKFTGNAGWSGYLDGKYNPATEPGYGQYIYDNKLDGNNFTFNGNYGFKLGKKGFLNLTGNFIAQGKTYRQALDTNANSADFMYTNIYRRAHGDGSMTGGGGFFNMELPLAGTTTFYAFGGLNYKASDAYAFTRNFSARPDRFPTNTNGGLIYVPSIMKITSDADTFFNPQIQTNILDGSLAAGVKGGTDAAWTWDVSNTLGYNNFHFYGDKTFNASLGSGQTRFDDGGFNFLQNTVNANFSKKFFTIAQGLNLAMGAEYRYERYALYAGEEGSYKNYDPTGEKATGSQGFPGYQPGDEIKSNRSVIGAYADAELDITRNFLVSAALRAENYSDFGFTLNYKLATRYKIAPNFNIRGSVSTGFRAPSLAQINFSSTFTTVQGGNIAEVRIVPNYLDITRKAGIPKLEQEKSINASLGFTWKPLSGLSITLDGYIVNVKDRVVLTGQFDAGDPDLNPDLAQELQSNNIALAQFFSNAVDTKNRGLDIVIDYTKRWGNNSVRALLTGNWQKMEISSVNVPVELSGSEFLKNSFLSDREKAFILASAPNLKGGINLEYTKGKLTVGTRLTYFGKVVLLGYGEDGLGIDPTVPKDDGSGSVPDRYEYGGKLPVDIYFGYQLTRSLSVFAGSDNIFNVHPDLGIAPGARGWAFNNETGGPWDAVQMGGNGRRLFARLVFNF
jgi:iron complex outermembrane receptor protein